VAALIKARADVNIADPDGKTPLIAAASVGDSECVKLLLRHGADITAVSSTDGTTLEAAMKDGNEECIQLLAKRAMVILRNLNTRADMGDPTAQEVIAAEMQIRQQNMDAAAPALNSDAQTVISGDGGGNGEQELARGMGNMSLGGESDDGGNGDNDGESGRDDGDGRY